MDMSEKINVMFTEEDIAVRIQDMADKINKEFEGQSIKMVIILKGASFFGCDLAKRIEVPMTIDFMSCSSYGDGTKSSGEVKIVKDLSDSIIDENVIVIEDIVDSGRTLSALIEILKGRGAKCVKLGAFLSKPSRRVIDVDIDYLGYEIEDKFVVGYGLDYAQKYRNLPYIGEIEFI